MSVFAGSVGLAAPKSLAVLQHSLEAIAAVCKAPERCRCVVRACDAPRLLFSETLILRMSFGELDSTESREYSDPRITKTAR